MARILFLTQVLPYPLDSGAKIRAYYVLRHLARTHEVTLVSFVRDDDDAPARADHLASFCQRVHTVPMVRSKMRDAIAGIRSVLSNKPIVILRDEVGAMRALLSRLVCTNSYDAIHADQTSMAQYALYAQTRIPSGAQRIRTKTVLDVHNALFRVPGQIARGSSGWLTQKIARREARALERYERRTYRAFDHLVFVSETDRQALGFAENDPKAHTIPICVSPGEQPMISPSPNPRYVTHLGTMFWPPNIEGVLWFASEVLPLVLARVPDAHFVIVGKRPPSAVRELAATNSAIEVLGYVANPESILAQTAAFVVPLLSGAGMRVKILDAWRWGVPIVSTTLGAEGIATRHDENILIEDQPSAFAEAVVTLLNQPERQSQLREQGYRWVKKHYDWRTAYREWDQVYGVSLGSG